MHRSGMVVSMNQPTEVASPAETLGDLLKRSGRGYTKVRHSFTQIPVGTSGSKPGLLGPMVTERKRRSLILYLLLLTVWPWLKDTQSPLAASVWARAVTTEKGRRWSVTNVSEAWGDLEKRGLIERERLSRGVVVTPRREDGDAEYTDPGTKKKDRHDTYFTLPPEFWTDGWFETLSMPALAMLLAVASKTSKDDATWLTNVDAGKWFGLSPRSVEAGLTELADVGLLSETIVWVKAPLSPIGATKQHWYSLNGSFSTDARRAMQTAAADERALRLGETGKKAPTKPKKRAAASRSSGSTTKTTSATKAGTKKSSRRVVRKLTKPNADSGRSRPSS